METLDWLERMFGKIKQVIHWVSIDCNRTGVSINERMEMFVHASKIANQNTGEMVGVVAHEPTIDYGRYDTNKFRCRISVDMAAVREEQPFCRDLPRYHSFGIPEGWEMFLMDQLQGIYGEVEGMVANN
jgi:hypothetical protein